MSKLRAQSLIVGLLLLFVAAFVLFAFGSAITTTQILGFGGEYAGGNLRVTRIMSGSPADKAGLALGDVVLQEAGTSASAWHRLYVSDMATYLEARNGLIGSVHKYVVLRGASRLELSFGPRPLNAVEILRQYGVRVSLVLFVLALAVFVLASRMREQRAFLTCLCFCFAALWFASDQPHWPQFSSPLIHGVDINMGNFVDLVEIFSMQLVMGTLVHIALMFPRRTSVLDNHPWLPLLIYAAALVVPVVVLAAGDGGLGDRLRAAYVPRLVVNTVLIVAVTVLMAIGYRRCESPAEKEASRWIVLSVGVIALAHLVFWNLPAVISGRPLISNYNWLLLTVVLLPVSLTMSITNHELFGIRGIIRGRIRLLKALLEREKRLVQARDVSIQRMQNEMRQLHEALDEYAKEEQREAPQPAAGMEKLEREYPQLTEVRKHRLIGISPKWEQVFEQVVLAARGAGPVVIVGESGTGKTDVAWAVHQLSDRRMRDYREISCAQFEHADPAFALGRLFGIGSGHGLPNVPKDGREGLLEECDNGTLLLDDFDRLPLSVQDLFLYPLEGKPFEPGIGTGLSKAVSVKFIFATNQDPEELASRGKLRSDVLARITARIDVPALRERKEDIPLLVEHFVERLCADLGHDISVVSTRAMNLLARYDYRAGNVRELRAELHQAIGKALLEHDSILRAGYLSERIRAERPDVEAAVGGDSRPWARPERALASSAELDVLRKHRFQITAAERELGYSHKSRTLSNHFRGMCIQALADAAWSADSAAALLAGPDNPGEISKLKSKIERFQSRIEEHVRNNTKNKLFNNLPAAYHDALNRAIARVGR